MDEVNQEVIDNSTFESGNINAKWVDNIYENLKNLESLERLAREGCNSLLDYIQIPMDQRPIIIADLQFKNLKFIVTETALLLTDLTPVLEKEDIDKFRENLKRVQKIMEERGLFVKEHYSARKKGVVFSQTTKFFDETLEFLTSMRVEVIEKIAHILYVKAGRKQGFEST